NQIDAVREILKYNPDLSIPNLDGLSPLAIAVQYECDINIFHLLLKHTACQDELKHFERTSPLQLLKIETHTEIAELFIQSLLTKDVPYHHKDFLSKYCAINTN